MRFFKNNILLFIFIALNGMSGYAGTTAPPAPTGRSAKTTMAPDPPFPIDENLILLGTIALLLGLYTIYKPIKKASN